MTKSRALVLVTTSFPIAGDGSEAAGSFVSDLVEEVAVKTPVRVVAPGVEAGRETWGNNIEVFRFAAPSKPLSTLKPWRLGDLRWIRKVLRGELESTRAAVNCGETSHILALWGLPCGEWARRVARESKIDYSVWLLGSDVWGLGRIPLVRSYLARVIQWAKCAYADGIQLAEDARQIGGRKIEFLPSTRRIDAVRTEPLRVNPPYRLLFLGRWHLNKGLDLLLDALKLLREEDWSRISTVEICGGGPLEEIVRHGVSELRAAGRPVELRGYLDKVQAVAALLRADYVLIPSRIESIPVIFSDAMKLGAPVVAMPVGDLQHLIKTAPQCGLSAASIEPSAFADALSRALQSSPMTFSEGTKMRASEFELARSIEKLMAPVRDFLNG